MEHDWRSRVLPGFPSIVSSLSLSIRFRVLTCPENVRREGPIMYLLGSGWRLGSHVLISRLISLLSSKRSQRLMGLPDSHEYKMRSDWVSGAPSTVVPTTLHRGDSSRYHRTLSRSRLWSSLLVEASSSWHLLPSSAHLYSAALQAYVFAFHTADELMCKLTRKCPSVKSYWKEWMNPTLVQKSSVEPRRPLYAAACHSSSRMRPLPQVTLKNKKNK